ncbi:bifunctional metallophosphatase/5'-nucleotidase [Putridiphycobacter roseus]|uniref:Bifunctional metallophosphatase/5'-nucleotidase n=1 Tax=Putridiphycobacter roseus TaxID=2219161 RepID=A0A2W1NRW0_9FLAO|nr:metallophosphoesterase [Putridiphycobacter roseus]PZE17378.1 bifunctional metallophosphatase/5'-nucleotidase [Putridiphycobacter roseus]
MNRRHFFNQLIIGAGAYSLLSLKDKEAYTKLTILHTNDTHSRIDPFPLDDSKYPGLGGIKKRKTILDRIRKENEHVLLLDAGDIFQGTPYFNMYHGEIELKAMSALKYDAATMGNHDFDGGLNGFLNALTFANFPFICSNYNFENTQLRDKTIPYKIVKKAGIKIGILGVGIELKGLVSKSLYEDTIYQNPIEKAQEYADILKFEQQCDYIICLSHLGYQFSNQVDDIDLAQQTNHINLIIGGHTHTFMKKPAIKKNKDGKEVMINQVGWAGINLGQIEVYFHRDKRSEILAQYTLKTPIQIG